jgi:hypothetical protein
MKDYQDIDGFKKRAGAQSTPKRASLDFYGILKPTTGRYAQKLKFVFYNYFAIVPKTPTFNFRGSNRAIQLIF